MIHTDHALALARHYAEIHGVPETDILGRNRSVAVSAARDRVYTGLRIMGGTYCQIAHLMGRDHSTVLHGVRKVLG